MSSALIPLLFAVWLACTFVVSSLSTLYTFKYSDCRQIFPTLAPTVVLFPSCCNRHHWVIVGTRWLTHSMLGGWSVLIKLIACMQDFWFLGCSVLAWKFLGDTFTYRLVKGCKWMQQQSCN